MPRTIGEGGNTSRGQYIKGTVHEEDFTRRKRHMTGTVYEETVHEGNSI